MPSPGWEVTAARPVLVERGMLFKNRREDRKVVVQRKIRQQMGPEVACFGQAVALKSLSERRMNGALCLSGEPREEAGESVR